MDDAGEISRRDFLQTASIAIGATAVGGVVAEAGATPPPAFVKMVETRIAINGRKMAVSLEPRVTLLDLLRERVGLTGTKKGCNEGACGACTVLLDGHRINACMTLVASCDGREVITVEGLAGADGTLHPVQQAFIDHDALQCGYCTAGQVVSAVACIREGHAKDEVTVREWMSGNICRCAAYPQITAAVLAAGRETR